MVSQAPNMRNNSNTWELISNWSKCFCHSMLDMSKKMFQLNHLKDETVIPAVGFPWLPPVETRGDFEAPLETWGGSLAALGPQVSDEELEGAAGGGCEKKVLICILVNAGISELDVFFFVILKYNMNWYELYQIVHELIWRHISWILNHISTSSHSPPWNDQPPVTKNHCWTVPISPGYATKVHVTRIWAYGRMTSRVHFCRFFLNVSIGIILGIYVSI